MLLRRFTILCLMIAGVASIAGLFVDRKYDVYSDQPLYGPVASAHTPADEAASRIR